MPVVVDVTNGDRLALFAAVQDGVHLMLAQFADRHIEGDVVLLGDRFEHGMVDGLRIAIPRADGAVAQRAAALDDELRVELHHAAQAGAGGAGAVRAVEAEGARLDLRQAEAANRAGEAFGEQPVTGVFGVRDVRDQHHAVAQAQRSLHRVSQARLLGILLARLGPADDQAIHNCFDGVILVAIQLRRALDLVHLTVHACAHEASLADVLENALVLALAIHDQGRKEQEAAALRVFQQRVDNLLDGLRADLPAAVRAVRDADARIEEPQVVVDFGNSADGGARVAAGPALVDGDGRAEAFDLVHVRLLHQPEELARIGRQRFDIAALPLSVDGIECQAGLAGA